MNWKTARIIDANGAKYKVGWDEHGWFSIQAVEENPFYDEEPDSGDKWLRMEDKSGNPKSPESFTPNGAKELIEAIEEGL